MSSLILAFAADDDDVTEIAFAIAAPGATPAPTTLTISDELSLDDALGAVNAVVSAASSAVVCASTDPLPAPEPLATMLSTAADVRDTVAAAFGVSRPETLTEAAEAAGFETSTTSTADQVIAIAAIYDEAKAQPPPVSPSPSRASPSPSRASPSHASPSRASPTPASPTPASPTPAGELPSCWLKLRGLPWSATEANIKDFFSDCTLVPGELHLVLRNGRSTGQAFAKFESKSEVKKALKHNRELMESRYIELTAVEESEVEEQKAKAVMGKPHDGKFQGVLRLRGLPYAAGRAEVVEFLKPVAVTESRVVFVRGYGGRPSGEALVSVDTAADVEACLAKHKERLGGRWIDVSEATKSEFESADATKQMESPPSHGGKERHPWADEPNVVKLRGLPYGSTQETVLEFFKNINFTKKLTSAEVMLANGQNNAPPGTALVKLPTPIDVTVAKAQHKKLLGKRYIEVFNATALDFNPEGRRDRDRDRDGRRGWDRGDRDGGRRGHDSRPPFRAPVRDARYDDDRRGGRDGYRSGYRDDNRGGYRDDNRGGARGGYPADSRSDYRGDFSRGGERSRYGSDGRRDATGLLGPVGGRAAGPTADYPPHRGGAPPRRGYDRYESDGYGAAAGGYGPYGEQGAGGAYGGAGYEDGRSGGYPSGSAAYAPSGGYAAPSGGGYPAPGGAYDSGAGYSQGGYSRSGGGYDSGYPAVAADGGGYGAYDTRGGAYDAHGGAYDTRGGAYDTRAPAYDTRGAAYNTRAPAYDTRAPAYDTRGAAAYDSRGGYDARGSDPHAGVLGAPPSGGYSSQSAPARNTLRMRGLPFSATEADISSFFSGFDLNPSSISFGLLPDGRRTGDATVSFYTSAGADAAMRARNRAVIGDRYVELFPQ